MTVRIFAAATLLFGSVTLFLPGSAIALSPLGAQTVQTAPATTTAQAASAPIQSNIVAIAAKQAKPSLPEIQRVAISTSLQKLRLLRPFATNFDHLKAAVSAYWRRHIKNPNAQVLTRTIMRHVSPRYHALVRGQVHAEAVSGTNQVRAALGK